MLKNIFVILFTISSVYASVGEISMLRGKAVVQRGASELNATIQMLIEKKDIIKTKQNTKIQITFNDNTVITLGSNTNFKVQDYLYKEQNSKARFSVEKGSFKVITGKIGKLAPKSFLFKTKTSLIGIRGTIFAGKVGIGKNDYIACIKGSIQVSLIRDGVSHNLNNGDIMFIDKYGDMQKIEKITQKNFTTISHLEQSSLDNQSSQTPSESENNIEPKTNNTLLVNEEKITQEEISTDDISNSKMDINEMIDKKVIANYSGKLNGVSSGKYTTSLQTTSLKANIQADMDMRVDFGGNNPLRVDIFNQQLTLNEASINGDIVSGSNLDDLKQQLSSSNQFTATMKMQQNISPSTLKIIGNYSKSENGLNTISKLDGTFKDDKASGITGSLTESTSGSINGVSIDRIINANFDVNKN